MSDININFSGITSGIQTPRTAVTGFTQQAEATKSSESTQSLVKSYFDSLRERSDGEAKQILEDLENSRLSQITKLFADVQTSTVNNTSRLFEDMRIKPVDEIDSLENAAGSVNLNANVGAPVTAQAAEPAAPPEQTSYVSGIREAAEKTAADEAPEAETAEKTGETDGGDNREDRRATRVKKATTQDQISANNEKLSEVSRRTAESAQKSGESVARTADSMLIDRETAFPAIEEFIKSFNELGDEINGSGNETVSAKAAFLASMTEQRKTELLNVGIQIYGNNELRISPQKFYQASDEDLERVFGEKGSFTEFVIGQAKQLASYAGTDEYQRANVYSDSGNITQVSSVNGIVVNMVG